MNPYQHIIYVLTVQAKIIVHDMSEFVCSLEVNCMPGGQHYIWSFVGALVGSVISAALAPVVINLTVDKTIKKLMHGSTSRDSFVSYLYQYENIPATILTDTLRRAAKGGVLLKPLDNLRHANEFDQLHFNPVKTVELIIHEKPQVDCSVVIGTGCRQPLFLQMPIVMALPVSAAAYSGKTKQAFLEAAQRVNTAVYMKKDWFGKGTDLKTGGKYILQINPEKTIETLPSSAAGIAMVEITLPDQVPEYFSRGQGTDVSQIKVWHHRITGSSNIHQTLAAVKERVEGIPVAVRIRTSNTLEMNMERALQAGADAIVLEGPEHSGMLLPAVIERDFGLSLPLSLVRARSFLKGKNSKISLIAHGRFWSAVDCVKALALGADAVIMDSVLFYGLAAEQITKALPWFPLETLLHEGSKRANKLDVARAADNLVNLMESFRQEITYAAYALGKEKVTDLNTYDLHTADPVMGMWLN